MSATTEGVVGSQANAEAIEAWDGPLFERFVKYRHLVVAGLRQFGDVAMQVHPPPPGARVLDIGRAYEPLPWSSGSQDDDADVAT